MFIAVPHDLLALSILVEVFTDFELFENVEKIPFFENDLTFLLVDLVILLVDEVVECEYVALFEEKTLELSFICQGKLDIWDGFYMLLEAVALVLYFVYQSLCLSSDSFGLLSLSYELGHLFVQILSKN